MPILHQPSSTLVQYRRPRETPNVPCAGDGRSWLRLCGRRMCGSACHLSSWLGTVGGQGRFTPRDLADQASRLKGSCLPIRMRRGWRREGGSGGRKPHTCTGGGRPNKVDGLSLGETSRSPFFTATPPFWHQGWTRLEPRPGFCASPAAAPAGYFAVSPHHLTSPPGSVSAVARWGRLDKASPPFSPFPSPPPPLTPEAGKGGRGGLESWGGERNQDRNWKARLGRAKAGC